ncbi:hypothetical protein E3P86_02522 [Wallemia ichthyophaga]|uniref:Formyl transferase N-terminal domain-containing protein n=1 Tax=Wallemia ichthyophaga TaxID=245174 RepID=A0A4T0J8L0_WALIC|nr:hypothetical protein E3P86_02522 [Wallemia ichthyophaga]
MMSSLFIFINAMRLPATTLTRSVARSCIRRSPSLAPTALSTPSRYLSTTVPRFTPETDTLINQGKVKGLLSPKVSQPENSIVLTLSCQDQLGVVKNVSEFLYNNHHNILSSDQFLDPTSNRFFMRITAQAQNGLDIAPLRREFGKLAENIGLEWHMHVASNKPKVMVMVSKIGHCLNDLLFRASADQIPIEIPLIVSNHPTYQALAKSYEIPFLHLPVNRDTKEQQEEELLKLVKEHKIDYIVLARYMQVLSPKLCKEMSGRIINIHHSFLPSFKGAKPYHQAYDRGVKLIGATAHFVTSDLDEGPIIEQGVERVDHTLNPKSLSHVGSNVESIVLARAVKWVSEHRVLLSGHKTVVFD